jgi:histidine ammonia-lyase
VKTATIGRDGWSVEQVWEAVDGAVHVELGPSARQAIQAAHAVVRDRCAEGQAVYVPVAHAYPGAPVQLDKAIVAERLR